MHRLFYYTILFFALFFLVVFCLLSSIAYPLFFNKVILLASLDSKRELLATIVTLELYARLKDAALFLTFFHGILLVIYFKKPVYFSKIKAGLQAVLSYPKWLWSNFSKLSYIDKWMLAGMLVLVLVQRLFLNHTTDVIYDEAWTYLAFTSKNPLVAACFYPTSNNHILFSHVTQITKILPFSILTNIRLAALVPNILAILTLFFCLRTYFKPLPVWTATLFFAFSFPIVYYGFVARGYSLVVLFFSIGFFSLLQIVRQPSNSKAWFRLMLSSVLGFYTIPVYLYPFLTLFGFALFYFLYLKNRQASWQVIKHGLATCLLTFLVYLPVFVVGGVGAVTHNKFVTPLTYEKVLSGFVNHVRHTIYFFLGNSAYWVFALLGSIVLFAILFRKNKDYKAATLFSLVCLCMAPIFIFIHKIIPVERTWIYFMVPLAFLMALFLNANKWVYPLFILTSAMLFINNLGWNRQMIWYDSVCEEDYRQGKWFSTYFQGKEATIITPSRVNTYLKFNGKLNKEAWTVSEEVMDSIPSNAYYIHYLKGKKLEIIPDDFKVIHTYMDYDLLKYETK